MRWDVLIVGTGHGGAQAAIALRQRGFTGSIAMIGAEPDPPYERPPLTKAYLAGEIEFERMLIRPLAFWSERGVELLLGRAVVTIDPHARTVTLAGGERLGWSHLVWAAGGIPRRLDCEGEDLDGVKLVRSRGDVDAIRAHLPEARRVAVIGGGYVGLEAAAVLRTLGHEVVLVEALDRVLSRVAGAPLSRFYEAEHRARGVDLRAGARVERILGGGGRATGLRLASGEEIAADLVIVGIGIAPAIAPLVAAGAEAGNGVHVDARCRTTLEGIFAIGDCAAHENAFAGGARIRLESVQNAHDQAVVAARAILGDPAAYDAIPWFWSHQYDLRLQTIGLSIDHDEILVRGDPSARAFSTLYLRDGRVVALDCVNRTKDYVQGKALILSGVRLDREALADSETPLKELAGALASAQGRQECG